MRLAELLVFLVCIFVHRTTGKALMITDQLLFYQYNLKFVPSIGQAEIRRLPMNMRVLSIVDTYRFILSCKFELPREDQYNV